jgi:putative membrane protein
MAFTFTTDKAPTHFRKNPLLIFYLVAFVAFWSYTGFNTTDSKNWWLENTLTFSAIILLVAFYKHFRFSDLSYTGIFVFLMLHVYGSQHTYAENPFGFWVQEQLGLERNHYDRLVHFGFGFLLAYPMHEDFWRLTKMRPFFTYALPVELTVSLGALYELMEWAVADLFFPTQGLAYLGTQGDIWDAQKDIAVALLGALLTMAAVSLSRKKKRP